MNLQAERMLWDACVRGETPRDVIARMVDAGTIASAKQARATLEKWAGRGLYDYGVAVDLGWVLPGSAFPRAA